MRLFVHRRPVTWATLLAFLFATAFPALAAVRQSLDPVAFATICRVDTGASGISTAPGLPRSKIESAHCMLCLGAVSPPPAADLVPAVVSRVPELVVLPVREVFAVRNPAALQPLNPRAPPRA